MQEGVAAGEFARAENRVPVPIGRGLRDEADGDGVAPGGLRVARLVARPHHHADLLHVGGQRLFDQDAEDRLFLPVAVDQGLQRQRALALLPRR